MKNQHRDAQTQYEPSAVVCGGDGGRGELVGVAVSSSDAFSSDSGRTGFLKNVVDLDKLLVLPEK